MHDMRAKRDLAEIAGSAEPIPGRAQALVEAVRRLLPFEGAWIAGADPVTNSYTSLGSASLDESTLAYLGGPQTARDIEATGVNRARPPLSPSDLPYPAEELRTWADCLMPAGFREGLGVGLFTPDGRHVGCLALLFAGREPPSRTVRRRLGRLASTVARGIDPMRSLHSTSRLIDGATAGVVLRADGGTQPLPGLSDHALLDADSPAVDAARTALLDGSVYTSYLWPRGGRHAPDGYTRITALASTTDVPRVLMGMAVLSPASHCRGLTPRELEVLGLMIEGCSNHEIATALVVAQRTVAAHVEHILVKLDAPTRTLAAVRAEREGLYVPSSRSVAEHDAAPS
jgi:DNA-binding CsgD family transcriptional regulator